MKPSWDKLMGEFKDHKTVLVADVDCDGTGQDLCTKFNIEGFPTLKYGNPDAMEDYDGEREYDDLKSFATELKPSCSPTAVEHCSEEEKKLIEKYMAMSKEDLEKEYNKVEDAVDAIEKDFEKNVDALQGDYDSIENKKKDKLKEFEKTGLKNVKKVLVSKGGVLKVPAKQEGEEVGEEGGEEDMDDQGEEGDFEEGAGDKQDL